MKHQQSALHAIMQSPQATRWLKRMFGFAGTVRQKKRKYYPGTNFETECPCDLPEAEEIVHETILSMSDPSYADSWTSGTFDEFFRLRMFKVADRLRDEGRRHFRKRATRTPEEMDVAAPLHRDPLDRVWLDQTRPVLATVIATSKLRGAPLNYGRLLTDFVIADFDQADIAKELKISEASVSSVRRRADKFLQKNMPKPKPK